MIWHNATTEDVLIELGVDATKGLSIGTAEMRKDEYGNNLFGHTNKKSFLSCFFSQLKNAYIIIFLVVALIYTVLTFTSGLADWWEPLMLFAVVILTALFAAFYQYKSANSLSELSDTAISTCKVLRDGIISEIPSSDLVPGDIVLLECGNYIPADGRIIVSNELRCDESPLTGEIVPVEKNGDLMFDDITSLNARANMVYAGCSVIHGTAKIVVTQTGSDAEIGRKAVISKDSGEDEAPVMQRLAVLGKFFSIVCLFVCALYFILSTILNLDNEFLPLVFSSLLTALSLIIATIPETLTAIGTVIIALGIRRMITSNIIPRKIGCIETLSGVSVICTDKTGILTENALTVSKIYTADKLTKLSDEAPDEQCELLLKLSLMCCEEAETDIASTNKIDEAFFKAGIKYLNLSKSNCDNLYPRLSGIPFDFDRKILSSVNMIDGKPIAIVRGAAEMVLKHCVGNNDEYIKIIDELCADALQVICIAVKQLDEIPANPDQFLFEENLSVAGLIALSDPIQDDALDYIEICEKSGIRTVMITGDHINTAKAVAKKMGILKDDLLAITGEELEKLSDDELFESIEKYSVFARVSPENKKRIVTAWQRRGKTIAVTGSETFDAAALQAADIGCAMGLQSTDVAKGVSDIFVTDGRFSGLVRSILRCRGVFDNIRKCSHYLFTCNIAELISVLFGVLIFKVSPLAAIHLLTVNLLTDCGPAIALGMQPTDVSVKHQAPKRKYSTIFSSKMTILSIIQSVVLATVTLVSFGIGNITGAGLTMAFATLTLSQIAVALNISSDISVIYANFLRNKYLLACALATLILTFIIVLTPVCDAFSLVSLNFGQFLIVLLFFIINLFVGEVYKFINKKKQKNI